MMSRKAFPFLLVGLLAALVLALPVLYASAQEDAASQSASNTIEFIGIIEAMDANTITVNGQVIDVVSAELNTALTIGAQVKVEGTLNATGGVVAREVNATDDTFEPD